MTASAVVNKTIRRNAGFYQ